MQTTPWMINFRQGKTVHAAVHYTSLQHSGMPSASTLVGLPHLTVLWCRQQIDIDQHAESRERQSACLWEKSIGMVEAHVTKLGPSNTLVTHKSWE